MKEIELLHDQIGQMPHRLGMYITSPATYENVSTFLSGLFFGFGIQSGLEIERELSKWYHKGKARSLSWFHALRADHKDLSEMELIEKLFQLLDQFFLDRRANG